MIFVNAIAWLVSSPMMPTLVSARTMTAAPQTMMDKTIRFMPFFLI